MRDEMPIKQNEILAEEIRSYETAMSDNVLNHGVGVKIGWRS